MSLPDITGTGRLIEDPELRFTQSGTAVCNLRLAFNSRRKNPQTNEWEDADVFYVRATAFKQMAENISESLVKGDEVNVTGRLKTDQWEDKTTGEKRSGTSMLVDSIGPNLRWGTAKSSKADRGGGGRQAQSADDPWGSTPPPGGKSSDSGWADEPPF
jgi:single-strand DNA-binding protein